MEIRINSTTNEGKPQYQKIEEETIGAPVIPYEDQKTIRKLYAGLPIRDTATGLTGFNGQIFLINTGTNRYFGAYIDGTLYKIGLT